MRVSTLFSRRTPLYALALAAVVLIALFTLHKEETIRLLYATNGDGYDPSAYEQFQQSTVANLAVERRDWKGISARELRRYDAVYLDPGLHTAQGLPGADKLQVYVRGGGELFLENIFAADVPLALLGASKLEPVQSAAARPSFSYPAVDGDLQGMQQVFQLFSDNFFKRTTMNDLPGFAWGTGVKPSTALTLVALDGVSIATLNAYGGGSVLLSSAFLPNRYFLTGYDMQSGMDPAAGFPTLLKRYNEEQTKPVPGAVYFDKTKLPLEPFFHFALSAANAQYRNEYVSFVSKRKYGLAVKKVLGPYGRPAMAYQNHFEAMPAIRDRDGIQWAEMLKQYHEIPSFSLVRSTYDWGAWKETVSAQLNEGTSAQPKFAGEAPNSFYGSGTHLFAAVGGGGKAAGGNGTAQAGGTAGGGSEAGAGSTSGAAGGGDKVITGAKYPGYKDLAGTIDLPYRSSPAFLDVNGDGRDDLLVGSGDGTVSVYLNLGPEPAASGTAEAVPAGVAPPDRFGEPQPLRLEGAGADAAGYRAPSYAALAVARAAGAPPSLLVGDGSGRVAALALRAGGRFASPTPVTAGGRPVQVHGPAAPAYGDVDGDGIPDLVVGDGDGRVWFYRGLSATAPQRFAEGVPLLQLSARFASPALRDLNGDGRADLVVGNNEGDLLVYVQDAPAPGAAAPHFTAKGPLSGESLNQMGTPALVGGHNSAPAWYDINHDGKDDLIVGQLEFGVPYAIDDPRFPFRTQLDDFIQYAKTNGLEIYPHLFVHNFNSDAAEQQEIALHKQAFERLGLPWGDTGTNQHTWRINIPDRQQTLRNEAAQNLWFNFGFKPSHVPDDPRLGYEYMWGMPFLMQPPAGGKPLPQPMLLYTPGPVLRLDAANSTEDIFQSFVKLDMPINYFEHIEPFFPANTEGLREFAAYFDKLRTAHDYNFMSEPQMARSFLTALTARVTVERSWAAYLQDKLKDLLLGTKNGPHLSLRLKPDFRGVPAQAGAYRTALGVSVERGERLQLYRLGADNADIYTERDGKLYVGLDRPLTLGVRSIPDRLHVLRSNVPVTIEHGGSRSKSTSAWTLHLNDVGMQQVKLYSPQPVDVQADDPGVKLDIQRDDAAHTVTVTHYGAAATIRVTPH